MLIEKIFKYLFFYLTLLKKFSLTSYIFFSILSLAVIFFLPNATLGQISEARLTPVVKVTQKVAPVVVNITCSSTQKMRQSPLELFFDNDFGILKKPAKRASLGSGIIVDGKNGLVMTNAHVISGADEIRVHLQDGREFPAEIKGFEPDFDLAVLHLLNAPPLPSITFGEPEDILPGETVIAIGNPFGFNHTVTTGVISALHRSIKNENGILTDLIQTDAAINPGNSGGPLLNLDGNLIGINTVIDLRGEGLGFAIPVEKVRDVLNTVTHHKTVSPIWLGLFVGNLPHNSQNEGIVIKQIYPNSPASNSILKPGDIITHVNNTSIKNWKDYIGILRNQSSPHTLNLAIIKNGKKENIQIKPAALDNNKAEKLMRELWGLSVREKGGNIIIEKTEGPASFLKKGDIIYSIAQKPVSNISQVLDCFRQMRMAPEIILGIQRDKRDYYARLLIY